MDDKKEQKSTEQSEEKEREPVVNKEC